MAPTAVKAIHALVQPLKIVPGTRGGKHEGASGRGGDVIVGALRRGVAHALGVARMRAPLEPGELMAQGVIVQKARAPRLREQRQQGQVILACAALGRRELNLVLRPCVGMKAAGEGVAPQLGDAVLAQDGGELRDHGGGDETGLALTHEVEHHGAGLAVGMRDRQRKTVLTGAVGGISPGDVLDAGTGQRRALGDVPVGRSIDDVNRDEVAEILAPDVEELELVVAEAAEAQAAIRMFPREGSVQCARLTLRPRHDRRDMNSRR